MSFSHDTASTELYTLSLHDALPISRIRFANGSHPTAGLGWAAAGVDATGWPGTADHRREEPGHATRHRPGRARSRRRRDRKSTRLNSSHSQISYAVFCLKKKKKNHAPSHNITINTLLSLFPKLSLYLTRILMRLTTSILFSNLLHLHSFP